MHLAPNLPLHGFGNNHAILANSPSGDTAEGDQATIVADEESVSPISAEQLAVGLAVAGIVGADPVLALVAEGSSGNRTEEELSWAVRSGSTEGKCRCTVAEDGVWSAGTVGSGSWWAR